MTEQEAIRHIEALYPPDSQYDDTRAVGRELMEDTVGNTVGFSNWRNMQYSDLVRLAKANLDYAGEQPMEHNPADEHLDLLHADAPSPYDP